MSLLVLLLGFQLVFASPAAAAAISVDPSSGTAGSAAVVSGSAFAPAARVNLCWDGTNCANLGQIDMGLLDTGFSTSVTIPSDALPGTHQITACQVSDLVCASTTFEVTEVTTTTGETTTTTEATTSTTAASSTTTTSPPQTTTTDPALTTPTTNPALTTTTNPSSTTTTRASGPTSTVIGSPTTDGGGAPTTSTTPPGSIVTPGFTTPTSPDEVAGTAITAAEDTTTTTWWSYDVFGAAASTSTSYVPPQTAGVGDPAAAPDQGAGSGHPGLDGEIIALPGPGQGWTLQSPLGFWSAWLLALIGGSLIFSLGRWLLGRNSSRP